MAGPSSGKSLLRCQKCKAPFKSEGFLQAHQTQRNKACIYRASASVQFSCLFCDQTFASGQSIYKHYLRAHRLHYPDGRLMDVDDHPQGQIYKQYAKDLLSPALAKLALGSNGGKEGASAEQSRYVSTHIFSNKRKIKNLFRCEACNFSTHDEGKMSAHRWTHSVEGEIESEGRKAGPIEIGGSSLYTRPADLYQKYFKTFTKGKKSGGKTKPYKKMPWHVGGTTPPRETAESEAEMGRRAARLALGRKLALLRTANEGTYRLYRYIFPPTVNFPDSAFINVTEELIRVLRNELATNKGRAIKCSVALVIELIKLDHFLNVEDQIVVPFRSALHLLERGERGGIVDMIAEFKNKIEASIETFVERGSGWIIR